MQVNCLVQGPTKVLFQKRWCARHLVSLCARISYSKIVCLIMSMTEHKQNLAIHEILFTSLLLFLRYQTVRCVYIPVCMSDVYIYTHEYEVYLHCWLLICRPKKVVQLKRILSSIYYHNQSPLFFPLLQLFNQGFEIADNYELSESSRISFPWRWKNIVTLCVVSSFALVLECWN